MSTNDGAHYQAIHRSVRGRRPDGYGAITFLLVHIWAISGGFYPSIRLDYPDRAVFYAGRCKRVCHCEKRPDFWGLSWFTLLTGIGGRRYLIAPCWDDLADLSL